MTVRKFYLLRLDLSVSDARIRAQSECCRSYQCVRFQRRRAYTRVYPRSLSGAYGVSIFIKIQPSRPGAGLSGPGVSVPNLDQADS
jgi:hypothetical protein